MNLLLLQFVSRQTSLLARVFSSFDFLFTRQMLLLPWLLKRSCVDAL